MLAAAASYYKATLTVTTGLSAPFNNLAVIYKQQVSVAAYIDQILYLCSQLPLLFLSSFIYLFIFLSLALQFAIWNSHYNHGFFL